MDVLVIDTQNGTRKKGAAKVASDLKQLRRGTKAYEVAHVRNKEHYEKLKRGLGVGVLILTALTGTAVMTTLAASQSSNAAAKILVGVLSVLSAVLAALNEKGPFGDQVKAHRDAATSFIKLHRKVIVLDRNWNTGRVDQEEVARQLGELELAYDDLKETSPDLRDYGSAREFADREEQEQDQ